MHWKELIQIIIYFQFPKLLYGNSRGKPDISLFSRNHVRSSPSNAHWEDDYPLGHGSPFPRGHKTLVQIQDRERKTPVTTMPTTVTTEVVTTESAIFTNNSGTRNEEPSAISIFLSSSKWEIAGTVGAVAVTLSLVASICLVIRRRNAKKSLRQLMEQEIREFKTGKFRASVVRNSVTGGLSAQLFPFRNEIAEKDLEIEFGKLLEQDHFISVFPGVVNGRQVIVKRTDLKTEFPFFKELLKDIKVMSYIGQRQHPNVIEFLGAVTSNIHNRAISAAFEASPLGNLKEFLQNNSTNGGNLIAKIEEGKATTKKTSIPSDKKNHATSLKLLDWCDQIATAMVYLQHENLVHGDLSASNVYLFPNNCIKISDLCSLRKDFERNYYIEDFRNAGEIVATLCFQKPPPKWRWMAIELFRLKKFSIKTDVWAFGVTLWEVFSLGGDPYPRTKWSPHFVLELEKGYRMEIPAFANQNIYQMLLRCWYRYPNDRINFVQIKALIKEFTERLGASC